MRKIFIGLLILAGCASTGTEAVTEKMKEKIVEVKKEVKKIKKIEGLKAEIIVSLDTIDSKMDELEIWRQNVIIVHNTEIKACEKRASKAEVTNAVFILGAIYLTYKKLVI
jgi:hypothetical protein